MFTTSSVYKNSFLHRLNPALKIVAFILIVAIIFLPLGFFSQIVLFIILSIFFLIGKIQRRIFWNIIKSVLILFVLLLLINWIIYKDPITANTEGFNLLGNRNLVWGPIWHDGKIPSNYYISNIWGGKINGVITDLTNIPNVPGILNTDYVGKLNAIIQQNGVQNSELTKLWNSLKPETKKQIIDTISPNLTSPDINDEIAQKFYWLISNPFKIGDQYYKLIPFGSGANPLEGVVYYQTRWYTLSPLAIQLAIFVSLKVMLMIMASSLLTTTTNSLELTYGFERLLSPFKIFRLPVNEAAMMIAIALRFIPSLLSESKRIMNAQASRGIDFRNGNFIVKMRSLVSLVVPLFSIAFKKAEELANAIDARAYNPRYSRTKYRTFKITTGEWIGFAFLSLLLGLFIGIVSAKILIMPLGLFEIGLLS